MHALRRLIWIIVLSACGLGGHASARQPTTAEGLDALSEDAVLNELAQRGLDSLLEHAFIVNKVPVEKQNGIKTLIALRRLGDPSLRLSQSERQRLVREIVDGIEVAMPSIRDPRLLMRQAADLISAGVEREVNTLEYWGESPSAQGALRPVALVVLKLLEQAQAEATRLADDASNRIKNPDDKPAIERYEKLDQLARDAEYTRHISEYFVLLAMDRADPTRRQLAATSIEYLTQFDTPEQQIRGRVRNHIGKLRLAVGETAAAATAFESVIAADAKDFPTTPDLSQQYEARYFRAIVALNERKPDEATALLDSLDAWQNINLPDPARAADKQSRDEATATRQGAAAASAMLRYRILSLRAEMETDPAKKAQWNEGAIAVLFKLLSEQESLRSGIYEQLAARLPANARMESLDPLLLQAVVQRGEAEMRRKDGPADKAILERALAGAVELSKRNGKGVDPQIIEGAALLIGFFQKQLGQDAEAVKSLLDFIHANPKSQNLVLALDNAQSLIGEMRKTAPDEPETVKLYERFLPLAIEAPFNRTQFAYEYARRLQLQGKASQAAEYFRRVPADDSRILQARFFLTIALQQQLDGLSSNDPQRAALASELQESADSVSKSASDALATASSEQQRTMYRSMIIRTTLLAAELARSQQQDAKRALELLEGFEAKVEGLPDASKRLSEMLLLRVEAYMLADRYNDATAELVKLLERDPGRGGGVVYELLQQLNKELDRAEASGDAKEVRHIAEDRARLTGFLVDSARKSSNESIRKLAYGYAVFDAEVQRFAAVQQVDAAEKERSLRKARELFQNLNNERGVAEYRAALPADQQTDAPDYDPAVVLGLARTSFDLGDFKDARDGFNRLLTDRRLGAALLLIEDRGVQKQIDNDNYWEAVVKLIQANQKLNLGIEESRIYLRQQIVRWSDRAGGTKWKQDFRALCNELIPDSTTSPATTTSELSK